MRVAFAGEPAPVDLPGIQHAFRVTDRVFSGSQPSGDAAFASLAREGVKVIISVDGGRPDVAAAAKYGLRYVHLPIGYDGIPAARVRELAKAATEAAGPIFVHCHRGKHRGPAAVGVICEAIAGWTPAQAEDWLKQAGTDREYPGLYRAVRQFTAPTEEELSKVRPLPETAELPALVEAMVAIDSRFEVLDEARAAGWRIPPGNAEASPAREATLLWEQLRELARTPDTAERPEAYRKHLAESANAVAGLRELLRSRAPDAAAMDDAFQAVSQSCTACHRGFRNEKQ